LSFVFRADSKFWQQELPASKPVLTPKIVTIPITNLFDLQICICCTTHADMWTSQVVTVFLLIAFLFIPIGVVTLNASRQVRCKCL
jgi:hypothetical protein